MLPISQVREPLNAVAIPALSHIQNEPIRYRRYYIKLVTLLGFITMPLMVFLFVCADEVIGLLLGSKWSGAINIFKILCITAFIQPVATTWGLVLVSLGQSKRYFVLGTAYSIIIVISFIIGLPWGAIGIAVAYMIVNYVLLIPTLWYCFRRTSISVTDFFSAISRPVVASIIMGLMMFPTRWYLAGLAPIVSVGLLLVISAGVYTLMCALIPGMLPILRELYSYRVFLSGKTM